MFDNLSQNRLVEFSLPIEEMLSPYWNFLLQIKFRDYNFSSIIIPDVFVEHRTRLQAILEKNQIQHQELEKRLTTFGEHDQEQILEDMKSLQDELVPLVYECVLDSIRTEILQDNSAIIKSFSKNCFAIYKDTSLKLLIYGNSNVAIEDSIAKFLRLTRPMKSFLSICLQEVDESIRTKFCQGFTESNFSVTIENSEDILSPIYHRELLVENPSIRIQGYDNNTIWINKELIKKNFGIDVNGDCNLLVKIDEETGSEKVLGALVGEYIIVLSVDCERYIRKDLAYYWTNISNNTYNNIRENCGTVIDKTSSLRTKLAQDFLMESKVVSFSNVLSFLQHNLYLSGDFPVIGDLGEKFFYNARLLKQLEQFENNKFLVGNDGNEVKLVIYNNTKNDGYNLRHYISKEETNLVNQHGVKKTKIKSPEVPILVPEIAFYYLRLFYEDFFENALRDVKEICNLQYVVGQKVCYIGKPNEIDSIVYVNDTIWFVELKTNLSTEYILSYRKKCQQWLVDCPEIASKMRFAILGFTGNNELEAWQADAPQRDGCNSRSFNFSLSINEDTLLYCCTETSFDCLKQCLIELFAQ